MNKLLPIIFVFLSICAYAQTDNIGQKVDSYLIEKMKQFKIPGIAIVVLKNNKKIKESSYGFADMSNKVPVTSNTVFPIASMDKQLTATCIMMLYEKGKIKLTDNISQFLDSVPVTWNKIQIRHLLSHTSGFPDEVPEYFKERYLISYTTDELLQNIRKQELQFPAGESWLYSDANFLLSQLIVEKVSGMSYGEFLQKNVLEPLEMNSTQTINPKKNIPNRTTSYYKNDDDEIIINTYRAVDFGPLYNDIGTTSSDFARYDIAINTNKLLKQETYNLMWTPYVLNNGNIVSNFIQGKTLNWADASYGYAWALRSLKNHRIIYHSGWTGTSITKLPDDSLTVLLFTNLHGGFNPDNLARYIAALYVPQSFYSGMPVINDPSPSTTLLIKEQILKMSSGTFDSATFTRNCIEGLLPAISGYSKSIQNMGSLQSLEFINSEILDRKKTKLFYKANYTNGVLHYQITMNDARKIDFVSVEK
jgi:CubicO group peptidase (beta-lactamase class C family)